MSNLSTDNGGQRRSRRRLLNILCHAFWKLQEKSLVALEPWHWPDSLFADTVVITDTALTPAPCPCLGAPEPSRRQDVPQPVYTESGNFIVPVDHPHTRPRPPSCVLTSAEANGYDAPSHELWAQRGVPSVIRNSTPPTLSKLWPCKRFHHCARHRPENNRIIERT